MRQAEDPGEGMRPAEALALDRQDVDVRHGVLHVRAGKQHKQREIPLHHSTISALRQYARLRDVRFPAPSTPAFFIAAWGGRMARGELNQTFAKLVRQAGMEGRGARARPRPYDLRHILSPSARSLTCIRPARTSTGGCRCCPPTLDTSIPPQRTGITPILGLFRSPLLCTRDGPVTWDDALP
jgi:integrase